MTPPEPKFCLAEPITVRTSDGTGYAIWDDGCDSDNPQQTWTRKVYQCDMTGERPGCRLFEEIKYPVAYSVWSAEDARVYLERKSGIKNQPTKKTVQLAKRQARDVPLNPYNRGKLEHSKILKFPSRFDGLNKLSDDGPDLLQVLEYAAAKLKVPIELLLATIEVETHFDIRKKNFEDCDSTDNPKDYSGGMGQIKSCDNMNVWASIWGNGGSGERAETRQQIAQELKAIYKKVMGNSPIPKKPGVNVLADALAICGYIRFVADYMGFDLQKSQLKPDGRLYKKFKGYGIEIAADDRTRFMMALRGAYNGGLDFIWGEEKPNFRRTFTRMDLSKVKYNEGVWDLSAANMSHTQRRYFAFAQMVTHFRNQYVKLAIADASPTKSSSEEGLAVNR